MRMEKWEKKTYSVFIAAVVSTVAVMPADAANEWVWTGGLQESNQKFNGIDPPSVERPATAQAADGTVYIFGGIAYGNVYDPLNAVYVDGFGPLNDLYRYTEVGGFTKLSGVTPDLNPVTVHGTLGVSSEWNRIGGRKGAVLWIDSAGNPWTFGGSGSGIGSSSEDVYSAALWKFDGVNWVWMKGPDTSNVSGEYGTKGAAAPANHPGARFDCAYWTDSNGNFWLFGGVGIDVMDFPGFLNDIWKFDGTNWTWVAGSEWADMSNDIDPMDPANDTPAGRSLAQTWVAPDGSLWLYGGQGYEGSNFGIYSDMWKFNGTSWEMLRVGGGLNQGAIYGVQGIPNPGATPGSRYNAQTWVDENGKFWLYGGQGMDFGNNEVLY